MSSDKLRDDIDRGGAGDKVNWPDPAAAPLGADDEASGHPPTREQLEMARQAETRRPDDPTADRKVRNIAAAEGKRRGLGPVLVIGVLALAAIAVFLLFSGV